ncbi:15770_t:CDS:2 [Racocetra persica]|uniref:15770_t:CDS:1 n=1 Tax=Racocetra persica TaxID=160502 RepID=A0ACA9LXD9_9GLOM|nr:15770_t:CDS:2 [Racocetra persica]
MHYRDYEVNNIGNVRSNNSSENYLDCFYPQEQRKTIKELGISSKNLESNLDLNDFINLEELNCSQNKLTALKINNCLQLRKLDCNNNCLQDLVLPFESEKLTELDVRNNNFSERDLSMFSHLVNLKYLGVGNRSSEFKKQYQEVETAEKEALCQKTSRLWQQYKLQTKKIKFEEIERIQKELFNEFYKHYKFKKKQSRKKRDREVKEAFDKLLNDNLSCQIHPQAVYTSRCLSEFTDNLPKLRILEQLTVNINASAELSQSMQFDILQSNTKQQLLPVFPTITNQREIKRQKTLEEPLYQTEQNQQQFQAQIQIPPKNN